MDSSLRENSTAPSFILVTHLHTTHSSRLFHHPDYLYRLLHRLHLLLNHGYKGKLKKSPLFRYAHDLDLVITIRPLKSVSLKNTILFGLLFRYNTR